MPVPHSDTGECSAGDSPQPGAGRSPDSSFPRPHFVIPAKAGIQGRRRGGTNDAQTLPATGAHFHTLMWRPQPAREIAVKACPGLRSGMDVCRHDRWSRHAGVRWNPLALVIPALQIVIPAKAGIQRGGVGCGNDTRTLPPTNASNFHTLVCRRQPACAIAVKACPGLRSGIDRSSSLSLVIRDIPWSFRPLNSSFRRMPESRVREGET